MGSNANDSTLSFGCAMRRCKVYIRFIVARHICVIPSWLSSVSVHCFFILPLSFRVRFFSHFDLEYVKWVKCRRKKSESPLYTLAIQIQIENGNKVFNKRGLKLQETVLIWMGCILSVKQNMFAVEWMTMVLILNQTKNIQQNHRYSDEQNVLCCVVPMLLIEEDGCSPFSLACQNESFFPSIALGFCFFSFHQRLAAPFSVNVNLMNSWEKKRTEKQLRNLAKVLVCSKSCCGLLSTNVQW